MVFKGLYFILFDHSGYECLAGDGTREYAKSFRKHLMQSLVGSGFAIALAFTVATAAGRVEWSGPIAWNKAIGTIGAFFGAWGTWFGVTERNESYKKSRLDEHLRDVVFGVLFVPGVIFGAIGTLW